MDHIAIYTQTSTNWMCTIWICFSIFLRYIILCMYKLKCAGWDRYGCGSIQYPSCSHCMNDENSPSVRIFTYLGEIIGNDPQPYITARVQGLQGIDQVLEMATVLPGPYLPLSNHLSHSWKDIWSSLGAKALWCSRVSPRRHLRWWEWIGFVRSHSSRPGISVCPTKEVQCHRMPRWER